MNKLDLKVKQRIAHKVTAMSKHSHGVAEQSYCDSNRYHYGSINEEYLLTEL